VSAASSAASRNGSAERPAPATALVIPCHDEAARLDVDALHAFAEARPWLHLWLVDDGSRDGTPSVLAELAARAPERFSVLAIPSNVGKGEAVRQGMLRALDEAPELVGFWDADLATPLAALERFLHAFDERPSLEILIGSRVQLLGRHIERNPARHYLGRVAATFVSRMLGIAVYDTQCGAKLFRATPRLREILSQPFLSRWIFDVELLARWMRAAGARETWEVGERVRELPLEVWRDVPGSRIHWLRDGLRVPVDLWRIHRWMRRG
jgi:dolichyl-phosphate beta-glucosyltransferase